MVTWFAHRSARTTQVRGRVRRSREQVAPHWPRGVHPIVKGLGVFAGRPPIEPLGRVRCCTSCRLPVSRPRKVATHPPEGPARRRSLIRGEDGEGHGGF